MRSRSDRGRGFSGRRISGLHPLAVALVVALLMFGAIVLMFAAASAGGSHEPRDRPHGTPPEVSDG